MSTKTSFSNETSERYSRALFEIGKESKELDKLEDDVKKLQSIFNSSSEINNFIKDPTRSRNVQINFINVLSEKLNLLKNIKNFFLLLFEK